jgi:hypothetical protein
MTQIDLGNTNTMRRRTMPPPASPVLTLYDTKCSALIDANLRVYGALLMNSFREALLATEQQGVFQFVDGNDELIQMQGSTYNTYQLFEALLHQHIAREREHVGAKSTPANAADAVDAADCVDRVTDAVSSE